jgi:general secretion pathway protein E
MTDNDIRLDDIVDMLDYTIIPQGGITPYIQNSILPIRYQNGSILVAYYDDNEEFVNSFFSTDITIKIIDKKIIDYILSEYNTRCDIDFLANEAQKQIYNDNSIQDFFDRLFIYAIDKRCSDIHFEVFKSKFFIKFRIDGLLKLYFSFDKEFYNSISIVMKVYANLDISQKRLPQNGRFRKNYIGKEFDFRISTIPIIDGESIVIRILDKQRLDIPLEDIGFGDMKLNLIQKHIERSVGMVLVTGPTGSGKTTTLYSMLNYLKNRDNKIITIEDPVEYQIENISQIAVSNDIGLSFSEAIKNILRQDPDVIMIGEIRDSDSLNIAMQAALTGHLVLATIHTNDSLGTINRLLDLDAQRFIISSTIKLIISQRLIKKLCDRCKSKSSKYMGYDRVGCSECSLTGYNGRAIVNEIFEVDSEISAMIYRGDNIDDIIKNSQDRGFVKLYDDGLNKVDEGVISYEDFIKYCTV